MSREVRNSKFNIYVCYLHNNHGGCKRPCWGAGLITISLLISFSKENSVQAKLGNDLQAKNVEDIDNGKEPCRPGCFSLFL